MAEGISRDEIAIRHGVTVGSLQVTSSRLGISLRRITLANGSHHTPDVRGRTIPAPGSVGIAHVREQQEVSQPKAYAAPVFAIMMRHKGNEKTTDISLTSPAIETLALEAMSRDLAPAELRADFGFSDMACTRFG